MKFMISTYATQADYDAMGGKADADADWSLEDFAAMGAFMESFNRELDESGELIETLGLDAPVHTRRIQLKAGLPVVTDGPYAETQEVLAGYWIVECASFDRATAGADFRQSDRRPQPRGGSRDGSRGGYRTRVTRDARS